MPFMTAAPRRRHVVFSNKKTKIIGLEFYSKTIQRFYPSTKKFRLKSFLLAAIIFWIAAPSIEAQAQNAEKNNIFYEFGAGDVLEVLVFDEPQLSRTVFVRTDGRISLPLVGELIVAGMTPESIAQQITEKLMKIISEPKVTVILSENNSKVYYILGQIATPGQYRITQPVTVLQAIAQAGGFLEWAKRNDIKIFGGPQSPEKIFNFNYNEFLKGNNIEQNIVIKPGDTIVIP